jgi:cold shock CspA family protein
MAEARTMRGTVIAFDDAMGFGDVRSADDQRTYFFHCTQIGDGTRTIAVGAEVTFRVAAGRLGRWEAVDVLPLGGSTGASQATAPGFACPVCGAPVAGEPSAYEICVVCGWEDDPVQSDDPAFRGGANTMSLDEARADWRRRQG